VRDVPKRQIQNFLFLEQYFFQELGNISPHVMFWAAMYGKHVFCPYIFEGSVNQGTYLTMLRDWFVSLERLGLLGHVWFQQGGAPAHYAITAREFLNKVFRDKWIGRGSQHLLALLERMPQTPDLSSCDNVLWGFIKQ
jgi:hypothetical protein